MSLAAQLHEARGPSRDQINALRAFAKAGKTWAITMADVRMKEAAKLKKLGLLKFVPRGGGRGSDAVVTDAGHRVLEGQ